MNWGYKVIIVFILFAAGMLTMVTKSMRAKIDMVTPDYYKEELKYQQVIDGQNNVNTLSSPAGISQTEGSVIMQFPSETNGKTVDGQITFYRPSDINKDLTYNIKLDKDGRQAFQKNSFVKGVYKVKIEWLMNEKPFYQEQVLNIN